MHEPDRLVYSTSAKHNQPTKSVPFFKVDRRLAVPLTLKTLSGDGLRLFLCIAHEWNALSRMDVFIRNDVVEHNTGISADALEAVQVELKNAGLINYWRGRSTATYCPANAIPSTKWR